MRQLIDSRDSPAELEVDGGIKSSNVARVVAAGATIIVVGSAIFRLDTPIQQAITKIRMAAAVPVIR